MEIQVEQAEGETRPTYNLHYCEDYVGCMYCNIHNIWIYEPHGKEALLLNAEEIQEFGKNIAQQAN